MICLHSFHILPVARTDILVKPAGPNGNLPVRTGGPAISRSLDFEVFKSSKDAYVRGNGKMTILAQESQNEIFIVSNKRTIQ